jgi:hypothetical protein
MRTSLFWAAALGAHVLTGCVLVAQQAAKDAVANFTKCTADNMDTREGQMVTARMWRGDGTDTAAKLSDPKPLAPAERDALVQLHNRALQCRQIIISHDNRYAAWEAPIYQEFFERSDQIFYKLASGEIPVGLANKLSIESVGKLQVDLSKATPMLFESRRLDNSKRRKHCLRLMHKPVPNWRQRRLNMV